MAADSAVTFGPSQNLHTISDTQCKISIIQNKMIVAGTGQVGMGQRFAWTVEQLWKHNKLGGGDPIAISRTIASEAIGDFRSTDAPKAYGALLAFPAAQKAEICEFAVQDFQPELNSPLRKMPFGETARSAP